MMSVFRCCFQILCATLCIAATVRSQASRLPIQPVSAELKLVNFVVELAKSFQIQEAQMELQKLYMTGRLYEFVLAVNYLQYLRNNCLQGQRAYGINQILMLESVQDFMSNPWNSAYYHVIEDLYNRLLTGNRYPASLFDSHWCEATCEHAVVEQYSSEPYFDAYAQYEGGTGSSSVGMGLSGYGGSSAEMTHATQGIGMFGGQIQTAAPVMAHASQGIFSGQVQTTAPAMAHTTQGMFSGQVQTAAPIIAHASQGMFSGQVQTAAPVMNQAHAIVSKVTQVPVITRAIVGQAPVVNHAAVAEVSHESSIEASHEMAASQEASHEIHHEAAVCNLEANAASATTQIVTRKAAVAAVAITRFEKSIDILERPAETSNMVYYNTMSEYLRSETVSKVMEGIDAKLEGKELLLKIYTLTVQSTLVSHEIRIASAYYFKTTIYDFAALMTFIITPSATLSYEAQYFETLKTYMTGYEIYLLLITESTLSKLTVDLEFTRYVLQQISITTTLSIELQTSAKYYLSRKPFFDFATFVKLIPAAHTDNEAKLYKIMTEFLQGADIYGFTQSFYVTGRTGDEKDLLRELFLYLESVDSVPDNIHVAVKYYLGIFREIKFSMSKVVSKHLDLKEIFSDAFDFSTFNKEQYDAYDSFAKYISELSQDQIEGFNSWSDQTTRGEFTKLFLDHMIHQEDTPVNITSIIQTLQPLVTTGTTILI